MSEPRDPAIEELRRDLDFSVDLRGRSYRFNSTWGLFSPRAVDLGTRLLLKHIHVSEDADCLDVGCGYGPIGLVMATLASRGSTLMVDKDFVAVDYARRNAERNHITNIEVQLSDGLRQVQGRSFDVIATNLPAKSGKEFYTLLFHDAWRGLNTGGCLYVVSLSGLRKFVARLLQEQFGNCTKLKTSGQYTLARAER